VGRRDLVSPSRGGREPRKRLPDALAGRHGTRRLPTVTHHGGAAVTDAAERRLDSPSSQRSATEK
jgi:hypothetical protein